MVTSEPEARAGEPAAATGAAEPSCLGSIAAVGAPLPAGARRALADAGQIGRAHV